MSEVTRRAALKVTAWSVPIIAVAVATPLAAASMPTERIPVLCTPLTAKGQPMWQVEYNDGTSATLNQGDVNSDKTLQALCRGKGPLS